MPRKIMVVDDSSTVRQQLEAILAKSAFEVVTAGDGLAGLQKARSRDDIDLFVVDVNMPGMNGLELIRELRQLPSYAATPIFVLTTESTMDMAQTGKAVGATAWIVKPVDAEVLLMGVESVLGD